jgi:hypothetical protein
VYILSFGDGFQFEGFEVRFGARDAVSIIKDFPIFSKYVLLHCLVLEEVLIYVLGGRGSKEKLLYFGVMFGVIVLLDLLNIERESGWPVTPSAC